MTAAGDRPEPPQVLLSAEDDVPRAGRGRDVPAPRRPAGRGDRPRAIPGWRSAWPVRRRRAVSWTGSPPCSISPRRIWRDEPAVSGMVQPRGCGCRPPGRVRPGDARRSARMLAEAERAARLETDPTLQGFVIARITLGAVLSGLGRQEEAVPVLTEAWERSAQVEVPVFIGLQAAGLLGMCLLETGREEEARRLCIRLRPPCRGCWTLWGTRPLPPSTFLVAVEGRLAYHDGRSEDARRLLTRAAELARIAGHPSQRVYVLTALADAHLAAGDRTAARSALAEARETADTEIAFPATAARLAAAEERIGRGAARAARRGRSAGRGADRPGALPAARAAGVRSASVRSVPSSTCRSTRSRATRRACTGSSARRPAPRRSSAAANSASSDRSFHS